MVVAWACGADLHPWKCGAEFRGSRSAPAEDQGLSDLSHLFCKLTNLWNGPYPTPSCWFSSCMYVQTQITNFLELTSHRNNLYIIV